MIQYLSKSLPLYTPIIRSRFLSSTSHVDVTLPPNLILPDLSILNPPKPSIIKPLEYLFPQKFTQTSIFIKNFINPESEPVGTAYLEPKVFGVPIRQDIIHQIVRYQLAKIRQPQCTKRIGDIRGSTRKLYRQKGTGRARVGQSRSSIRRGGMKAHGPVLRDFSFDLNRKTRALGLMIALAAKHREGNLLVVDKVAVNDHKTKSLTKILDKHGIFSSLTLFVDNELQEKFDLASRNVQSVEFLLQNQVNVYDVVKKEKVVISSEALVALQARLISQREYNGKMKARQNNFAEYERLRKIGREEN